MDRAEFISEVEAFRQEMEEIERESRKYAKVARPTKFEQAEQDARIARLETIKQKIDALVARFRQ